MSATKPARPVAPTYTEEQVNGLLDKINELKRAHDTLRAEVVILRTLLTKVTLPDSSSLRLCASAGKPSSPSQP